MLSPLGGAAEKPFPLPALKKTIPDVMSNVRPRRTEIEPLHAGLQSCHGGKSRAG